MCRMVEIFIFHSRYLNFSIVCNHWNMTTDVLDVFLIPLHSLARISYITVFLPILSVLGLRLKIVSNFWVWGKLLRKLPRPYCEQLTRFPPITIIVVCSLICVYTFDAYIANNMDPDQTAPFGAVWSGFIVFASMIKNSLKCIWINAADVKSRRHFQDKNVLAGLCQDKG